MTAAGFADWPIGFQLLPFWFVGVLLLVALENVLPERAAARLPSLVRGLGTLAAVGFGLWVLSMIFGGSADY